MALYAAPVDVIAAWPKVLTSSLTGEEIATMLQRASDQIDSELCARYTVPFASPYPPMVVRLAVDLAMLDILHRAPSTPEFVQQRIVWAQDYLQRLRDGEVCLVDAGGGPVAEAASSVGAIDSNTRIYTPVFGAQRSLSETVDPDRVQAESDARS